MSSSALYCSSSLSVNLNSSGRRNRPRYWAHTSRQFSASMCLSSPMWALTSLVITPVSMV